MLPGNAPVVILKEGTQRDSGKKATQNNIAAAKAIAEAVRSTLGPKGMDKMLVDSMGDVIITNDGVTILKEVEVQHPAAKMIVEIAKTQDSECGDGTTTAVILAGELLKNAEELIDRGLRNPTPGLRGIPELGGAPIAAGVTPFIEGSRAITKKTKKTKSKFNKAVAKGMAVAKASTSYGPKGKINNAKKAFSAVTKTASSVNKTGKVAKSGIKRKLGLAMRKIFK